MKVIINIILNNPTFFIIFIFDFFSDLFRFSFNIYDIELLIIFLICMLSIRKDKTIIIEKNIMKYKILLEISKPIYVYLLKI